MVKSQKTGGVVATALTHNSMASTPVGPGKSMGSLAQSPQQTPTSFANGGYRNTAANLLTGGVTQAQADLIAQIYAQDQILRQRAMAAFGGNSIIGNTITRCTGTPSTYVTMSTVPNPNATTTVTVYNDSTCDSTTNYYMEPTRVDLNELIRAIDSLKLPKNHALKLEMPDGAVIYLDDQGNYRVEDKDAKIVYKANRIRNFNRYINASDLLEDFIKYIGKLNVTQQEFLSLPIELFIKWLVVEAARADGEEPIDWVNELHKQALLPPPKITIPRCLDCGKFIKHHAHKIGINFCNTIHMERHLLTTR